MGTHTEFTGAIQIKPQIQEPLASKLAEWLQLRHMRRDVSALEKLYPTEADRKAHTLFNDGNFGEEGEFYIPDITKDFDLRAFDDGNLPEGLASTQEINHSPKNCPNLYSDLALVHSEDGSCSYLGWNGAEKAYNIPEWLELLAGYLIPRGYHMNGDMFAVVEYGREFYFLEMSDGEVFVEEFIPDTTHETEFQKLFNEQWRN